MTPVKEFRSPDWSIRSIEAERERESRMRKRSPKPRENKVFDSETIVVTVQNHYTKYQHVRSVVAEVTITYERLLVPQSAVQDALEGAGTLIGEAIAKSIDEREEQ